ncbi:MAG TPA: ornithine acetyltransferase, partial [Actinomycetales bacterium]|nr:ornithine acetyltransferase [Actinomycetales bacterium]
VEQAVLREALESVCLDLTRQLARDGEGATKLLTVEVTGGRDRGQAKRVAKAILNSPLVKTAVHGADPNWGRVAMAIGKCHEDTDIDPERVRIVFGDLETYPAFPGEAELARLTEIMRADEVTIAVDLGVAGGDDDGECTVYGCDLSREYVAINADYTT